LGLLFVFSLLVSVALFAGAPGQITLVSGQRSTTLPPQIEVTMSLKNGGWVDVRADPVIQASFSFSNGSVVVKNYSFEAVTLGAGTVTLSRWVVAIPDGQLTGVNVTAYLRMRGPVSETTRAFSVP